MAISPGSRSHNSSHAAQTFDVSVLAFPAATGRTVQGLMQLFNIDEPSAQRLISSVPLLLTQQVTAADAERLAQALRVLGARVVVEPTALPTAQHARWEQPGGYEEDLLPQPRMPAVQNDVTEQSAWSDEAGLEYDVLASQEPGYAAEAAISVAPSMHSPLDLELSVNEHDRMAEHRALRRPRQESIDLDQGTHSPRLELDAASTPVSERQREHRETSARAEQRAPVAPQAPARPRAAPSEPALQRRASVVEHPAHAEPRSKAIHLLQLLFAILVGAMGYWFDSSVLLGSAGLWSVAAHGVGLYQLFLGVRGLVT